jgi:hypothetical protein
MTNPLFSTYSHGENQVTGTILSVFEHLGSTLVEDILETALDESSLSVVSFESQFVTDEGVPDAVIRSSTSLFIETKIKPNAVDEEQLERHLRSLDEEPADTQRLIVLTPDATKPGEIQELDDSRVVWMSFDGLVSALEGLLSRDEAVSGDETRPPTEREAFLVRELIRFIYDTELTSGKDDRVLVIPARRAWDEFETHEMYFCQPERSFRPSTYLAFYRDNKIEQKVPRITGEMDRVKLTTEGVEKAYERGDLTESQRSELQQAVDAFEEGDAERYGKEQKVVFLDKASGFELEKPVENDKTAKDSETRVAFVYGQRYVSAEKLRASPEKTTELES